MKIFTAQIKKATKEEKSLIIMCDDNLCSNTWKNAKFTHKKMANLLMGSLDSCGLSVQCVTKFDSNHS